MVVQNYFFSNEITKQAELFVKIKLSLMSLGKVFKYLSSSPISFDYIRF
jgi:hypothetical protein